MHVRIRIYVIEVYYYTAIRIGNYVSNGKRTQPAHIYMQPEAAGAFETTICTRLFIDSKNINKVFEPDFSTCGREGRKERRWNRECGGDMMHRNIFTCVHISLVLASVAHLLCRFHALIHSNVKCNDTAGASKTLCWFFCFILSRSVSLFSSLLLASHTICG